MASHAVSSDDAIDQLLRAKNEIRPQASLAAKARVRDYDVEYSFACGSGVSLFLILTSKVTCSFLISRSAASTFSVAQAPAARALRIWSELLSMTVKTIQQRQAPLSGSPAKRISEKKL
jgi:hypothetical protein